jgi:hypothetical protein
MNYLIKNCFRIAMTILVLVSLGACGKQDKLSVYQCNYKHHADSCNVGCEKEKDLKISFLVNKEERSVMIIHYFKSVQEGSHVYKNCTIFENDSWDCSSSRTIGYTFVSDTVKMTNGIFTDYTQILKNAESINKDDKGTCAKKI